MEAMARRVLDGRDVTFASAGFLASGVPMPRRGIAVAAERGLTLDGHRSAALMPDAVERYDLVLTAARSQARQIVADSPHAWPRVFTLKQFARWAAGRVWDREVPLRVWLDAEAADRPRTELIGDSPADDIRDPVTGSTRLWREVADEIDAELRGGLVPLFVQRGDAQRRGD